MAFNDRQSRFLSAVRTSPVYAGWSDDEIGANIQDVLKSGDQTRISGMASAFGSVGAYSGWNPDEISSNVAEVWTPAPVAPVPQPPTPEEMAGYAEKPGGLIPYGEAPTTPPLRPEPQEPPTPPSEPRAPYRSLKQRAEQVQVAEAQAVSEPFAPSTTAVDLPYVEPPSEGIPPEAPVRVLDEGKDEPVGKGDGERIGPRTTKTKTGDQVSELVVNSAVPDELSGKGDGEEGTIGWIKSLSTTPGHPDASSLLGGTLPDGGVQKSDRDVYMESLDPVTRDKVQSELDYLTAWDRVNKVTASVVGFASSVWAPERIRAISEEKEPIATGVGKFAGIATQAATAAKVLGPAVSSFVSNVPLLAGKQALVTGALTRGLISMGISTEQGLKEYTAGRKEFADVMMDAVQAGGAGVFSMIPEIFGPANAWQLLMQPAAGLLYDAALDNLANGLPLDAEWMKSELANIAMDFGFAVVDVASGNVFKGQQAQMRAELGMPGRKLRLAPTAELLANIKKSGGDVDADTETAVNNLVAKTPTDAGQPKPTLTTEEGSGRGTFTLPEEAGDAGSYKFIDSEAQALYDKHREVPRAPKEIIDREYVLEQDMAEVSNPKNRARIRMRSIDPMLGDYGVTTFRDLDDAIASLNKAGIPYTIVYSDGGNLKGANTALGHADADKAIHRVWGEEYAAPLKAHGAILSHGTGDEFKEVWPNYTKDQVNEIRTSIERGIRQTRDELGLDKTRHERLPGHPEVGTLHTAWTALEGESGKPGDMARTADEIIEANKAIDDAEMAGKNGWFLNEETGQYESKEAMGAAGGPEGVKPTGGPRVSGEEGVDAGVKKGPAGRAASVQKKPVAPKPKKKTPAKKVKAKLEPAPKAGDEQPTEAQKDAGNYPKGHIRRDAMDISIENKKGSYREGTDPSGKAWRQKINQDYGYIRGTTGVDKDHIDVFIKPKSAEGGDVFVVNQVDPKTGKFDEHKAMMGFADEAEASAAYKSNYEKGWKGEGSIVRLSMEDFKTWAFSEEPKTGALDAGRAKHEPPPFDTKADPEEQAARFNNQAGAIDVEAPLKVKGKFQKSLDKQGQDLKKLKKSGLVSRLDLWGSRLFNKAYPVDRRLATTPEGRDVIVDRAGMMGASGESRRVIEAELDPVLESIPHRFRQAFSGYLQAKRTIETHGLMTSRAAAAVQGRANTYLKQASDLEAKAAETVGKIPKRNLLAKAATKRRFAAKMTKKAVGIEHLGDKIDFKSTEGMGPKESAEFLENLERDYPKALKMFEAAGKKYW